MNAVDAPSGVMQHMNGLRILALVTDAYGAGGGIAQYNRDLFGALDASGCVRDIVVLSRSGAVEQNDAPNKVRQLQPRRRKLAWALRALYAAWREGPFDVVFCGHLFSAPVAALAARIAGAPLWLQLHGIEAWGRPRPWLRRAAERSWKVTAVSRYTRGQFLAWARCAPETVKVLPNTVEERFVPGPRDRALLQRYALEGKEVLLTVSRLASSERYKGHELVLKALKLLGPQRPNLVYVIAGDGDDLPRLQALAAELGVAGNTRFVGYIDEADLPGLYRCADVFVMPSTGEGFGIVFLQAQACGVPVIAGDSDGSADPLRDGMGGALVGAADIDGLADAVKALLLRHRAASESHSVFDRVHFGRQVDWLAGTLVRHGKAL